MKKFTKIIALVLALVCICTAFAACGGNKDDGNTTKAPAVKVVDYDLTNEQYAFGVDKNQPELLTQVNDIIKEMKSDGTFSAICDKYFGGGTPEAVRWLMTMAPACQRNSQKITAQARMVRRPFIEVSG